MLERVMQMDRIACITRKLPPVAVLARKIRGGRASAVLVECDGSSHAAKFHTNMSCGWDQKHLLDIR